MDWILHRQMYCWLLAAFAFFFLFLSFPFISSQKLAPKKSQKIGPKKVGPLYLLAPLLITSGSELTFCCFPFTNHYSTLQSEANTNHQPEKTTIGISSTKIPSLKQATKIQRKLHYLHFQQTWRWSLTKNNVIQILLFDLPPKMLWNIVVPPTSSEYLACSPVFFGSRGCFSSEWDGRCRSPDVSRCFCLLVGYPNNATVRLLTLWETNMAMENGPFEDAFPIEHGDFPLPC